MGYISEKLEEIWVTPAHLVLLGFILQTTGYILMTEHAMRYIRWDLVFGHEWLGVIFMLLGIAPYIRAGTLRNRG